jgi:hypothetical protein
MYLNQQYDMALSKQAHNINFNLMLLLDKATCESALDRMRTTNQCSLRPINNRFIDCVQQIATRFRGLLGPAVSTAAGSLVPLR